MSLRFLGLGVSLKDTRGYWDFELLTNQKAAQSKVVQLALKLQS